MMVAPSGEKATEEMPSLCARCFSAFSSRDAAASTGAVRSGLKGWRVSVLTPASQTLSVLSAEPETIVFPSGEKATDMTELLCALSLLFLSSSVPVKQRRRHQLRPEWRFF